MYKHASKIISILIFLVFLCFLTDGIAYDQNITHRDITQMAIKRSNLETYLTTNLVIPEGIEKVLEYNGRGFTILGWLQKGSELEDKPVCRASNHFHNPLDLWNLSYMSDEPWYVSLWCDATGYATRYSNVAWGTGFQSPNGPTIDRINQQKIGVT